MRLKKRISQSKGAKKQIRGFKKLIKTNPWIRYLPLANFRWSEVEVQKNDQSADSESTNPDPRKLIEYWNFNI